MYELEDAEHTTLSKHLTLDEAKQAARQRWGDELLFDGDPNFGAREIYVYDANDEVLGFVQIT